MNGRRVRSLLRQYTSGTKGKYSHFLDGLDIVLESLHERSGNRLAWSFIDFTEHSAHLLILSEFFFFGVAFWLYWSSRQWHLPGSSHIPRRQL
jgi:hypothetical protein